MLTEKERAERLTGIGSSEGSAVLGVNPYKTADQVLQEKLGHVFPADDRLIECGEWGDILEPILRKRYTRKTGRAVLYTRKMFRHPDYDFLIAHLDGRTTIDGVPAIVECKTIRYPPKDWRDHRHWVQLQHSMKVMEYPVAELVVLIGGNEFQIHRFERDEEFLAAMLHVYDIFWTNVLHARKEAACIQS